MERLPDQSELERRKSSVAFFDLDNTLTQEFTIYEFTTFLLHRGSITSQSHAQIFNDRKRYSNKEIDYRQFSIEVVEHFYEALKDKTQPDILIAGEEFIPKYQTIFMPFAVELVKQMQQQGNLFVVSGAPSEAFLPQAARFKIPTENIFLLEGVTNNGVYTGEVKTNMAIQEEKTKAVEAIRKLGFNPQVSFAFGDSPGDLPILEAVDNRFIVEPGVEMRKIAQERGWNNSIVDRSTILREVARKIAEVRK